MTQPSNEILDDLVSVNDQIFETRISTKLTPELKRAQFSYLFLRRKELTDGEVVACFICDIGPRWNYQDLPLHEHGSGLLFCPDCLDMVLSEGLDAMFPDDDPSCDCCGGPLE